MNPLKVFGTLFDVFCILKVRKRLKLVLKVTERANMLHKGYTITQDVAYIFIIQVSVNDKSFETSLIP